MLNDATGLKKIYLAAGYTYRSAERNGWSRNDHPVPVSARSV